MKTTIDIPENVLVEAMRHTGARTKKDAILTAVERYNKLKRLEALNSRIRGTFKDFMSQYDLKALREDKRWEALE